MPREMFVLKNRYTAELSEANSHAILSHSRKLSKYSPTDVSIILLTDKNTFIVATLKKHTERLTVLKKDVETKRPRNVQSLMAS